MGYLEKNKIKYFSFILSVLVILVHSINMPPIYKIFSFENIFGIEYIGSIAAPGFFVWMIISLLWAKEPRQPNMASDVRNSFFFVMLY